jgi:hypothetical protein
LCSIWERRDEYIERFSTDLWRITKTTATIPITATAGPMKSKADIRGRLSAIGGAMGVARDGRRTAM